jgi:glycerol kinase
MPLEVLPQVQPALSDFGRLCIANLPLRLVSGDQSAVPFAFGSPDADTLYLNLGTGAFLQRVPGPQRALPPLLENPLPAAPWRAMEGTVNGAATALNRFAQGSNGWSLADTGGPNGPDGYGLDGLSQLTADAPLFLNAVGGLGSPDWRHDLPSGFAGGAQPEPGLAAAIVAESIVFLIQRNLQAMQRQCSAPQRILVCGGLSRADALCQAVADLSGHPLLRPAEHEATALGVAVLLSAAHNAADGPHSRWFLPQSKPLLAQRYRRWSAAMSQALA